MIFTFDHEHKLSFDSRRSLLGGKGAALNEMTLLGLPVPPGFTIDIPTAKGGWTDTLAVELAQAIVELSAKTGRLFDGKGEQPLVLSVRSGASLSMPGMMDTILNLGLINDQFNADCYARLKEMFEKVVFPLDPTMLTIPATPMEQLIAAVKAVIASWNSPRAVYYRKMHGLSDEGGTAVNVQQMVFGNIGTKGGSGVGFTRNPTTGANELFGEYLPKGQGEEVVSGTKTPLTLAKMPPALLSQLKELTTKLETHFRDVQDFEFTVEDGKLWLLQTRTGKCTAEAYTRIQLDLLKEGLIDTGVAFERMNSIKEVPFKPRFKITTTPLTTGLGVCNGIVSGKIALTSEKAVEMSKDGPVILMRQETSPNDIHGMDAAIGIATGMGGVTSHAAIVCRGMNKPCVVGIAALTIKKEAVWLNTTTMKEGDWLTIDGAVGYVWQGNLAPAA